MMKRREGWGGRGGEGEREEENDRREGRVMDGGRRREGKKGGMENRLREEREHMKCENTDKILTTHTHTVDVTNLRYSTCQWQPLHLAPPTPLTSCLPLRQCAQSAQPSLLASQRSQCTPQLVA